MTGAAHRQALIRGDLIMIRAFCSKELGVSHKATDKPCQDSVGFYEFSQYQAGIAVCADGHGSEKHFRSDTGSRLAVEIAKRTLKSFWIKIWPGIETGNMKNIEKNLEQIKGHIISEWRKAVENDFKQKGFTSEENELIKKHNIKETDDFISIYGTTLIAALLTVKPSYWFALQIGDGAVVIIDKDNNASVVQELQDEALGFGRTTSLCASDAAEHFRHIYRHERINGISVATDGVVDSFLPEKYLEFNLKLRDQFLDNPETAKAALNKFLPKLSEDGSQDDVGIAGVFCGGSGEGNNSK